MRSVVSRILLLALVVVIGVLVVRAVDGDGSLIAIGDEGVDELEHETFRVTSSARVAVEARGSVETTTSDTTVLAVTAWITRRSDGEVVWSMPARRPERGTFVVVRDTVALAPGLYEAYLSSYGDAAVRVVPPGESLGDRIRSALSGAGRAWHGDAGRWGLALDVLDGSAERVRGDDPEDDIAPESLWRGWAARSRDRNDLLFRVGSPSQLRVRAVGEVRDGGGGDSAFVVRVPSQDTVWVFREGRWAGGASVNRRADVTLELEPGLYRAVTHTDAAHAWGDWTATPPYAPWMWGLSLDRAPGADVEPFDDIDLSSLPVISEFTCVGADAALEDVFRLPAPATVIVRAAGELREDRSFDWGELEDASGETVWTMTYESTQHGGGADRNRRGVDILALEPGTYTLRYVSDDSHHCGEFSSSRPDDETEWGVSLYAADPDYDVARVTHSRTERGADATPPPDDTETEDEPDARTPGEVLARLDRLGNGADVSARFRLGAPDTLRIVALGELLRSEPLDYGWIENDQGDRVWEMTRGTSYAAGGADKNRRVDATVALGAGSYTLHFVTNGRHAFGSFDDDPPAGADEWGIRIERIPDATSPDDGP